MIVLQFIGAPSVAGPKELKLSANEETVLRDLPRYGPPITNTSPGMLNSTDATICRERRSTIYRSTFSQLGKCNRNYQDSDFHRSTQDEFLNILKRSQISKKNNFF